MRNPDKCIMVVIKKSLVLWIFKVALSYNINVVKTKILLLKKKNP